MKCDICGEVNDAVEIHMCKRCANKFGDNVNCIKRDLAIYKRALELACERLSREDVFEEQTKQDYYLKQAKKELEANE